MSIKISFQFLMLIFFDGFTVESFGIKFDFLPNYFINESTTRMAPIGGGLALVETLAKYAETVPSDITFFYNTAAKSLLNSNFISLLFTTIFEDNFIIDLYKNFFIGFFNQPFVDAFALHIILTPKNQVINVAYKFA